MRLLSFLSASVLALGLAALPATALADTIHYEHDYSTFHNDQTDFVNTGGNDYLGIYVWAYTGTQVTFTFEQTNNWIPSEPNGPTFTDLSGLFPFSTVTYDVSSTATEFATSAITFSGNSFYIDFAGRSFTSGSEAIFDLGGAAPSATPEPSSLVLLGSGILGLAGAARRRFAA